MKFVREVLIFLVKLALFFLIVGMILGFVIADSAHAVEGSSGRRAIETAILLVGASPPFGH
jgi:hypothetical protein